MKLTKYHFNMILSLCLINVIGSAQSLSDMGLEELIDQHGYQLVQMDKLLTGHDIMEATINGVTGQFIVDTGAVTVINDDLLGKFNIGREEKISSIAAAGAAGLITFNSFPLKHLSIEGETMELPQIGSTDLRAITLGLFNANGVMIDGIIGQDLLIENQAIIDVQANHLYLKKQVVESSQAAVAAKQADLRQLIRSKREFEIELGAIKSIKHEAFFLTTKASINNVEGLFVIDSGAGRSILHQAQLIKYQIDPKKIDRLESSSGAGGDFGLKIYSISDFEMSHIQLTKDQIAVSDLTSIVDYVEQETGVWVDGFLGQDLLAQHGAVIDVSGQKMYLHTNNPD